MTAWTIASHFNVWPVLWNCVSAVFLLEAKLLFHTIYSDVSGDSVYVIGLFKTLEFVEVHVLMVMVTDLVFRM